MPPRSRRPPPPRRPPGAPTASGNDAADVVARCEANRLVCVLEAHETTGYGEQDGVASLSPAVDYWLEIAGALKGQEKYVIVNLGNEPHGNVGPSARTRDTEDATGRLRAAGFDHTLMADAPDWGQDWSGAMRENAPAVFAADPDRDTVLSVHTYGVYDTAAEAYLGGFVGRGLPLAVGEFGHDHADGDPDEDSVMATARRLGLGCLDWSWSGNGGGVEYLDLATGFDAERLTPGASASSTAPTASAGPPRRPASTGAAAPSPTGPAALPAPGAGLRTAAAHRGCEERVPPACRRRGTRSSCVSPPTCAVAGPSTPAASGTAWAPAGCPGGSPR
ncbi:cellulase family glycosylhydrolase [Streptomyces roseolus]|uniref:cellulase family glycosylhydrolase n=1 Tax=Streptomyces roseolus TaxID=67358 RepID=UPI0037A7130F